MGVWGSEWRVGWAVLIQRLVEAGITRGSAVMSGGGSRPCGRQQLQCETRIKAGSHGMCRGWWFLIVVGCVWIGRVHP